MNNFGQPMWGFGMPQMQMPHMNAWGNVHKQQQSKKEEIKRSVPTISQGDVDLLNNLVN